MAPLARPIFVKMIPLARLISTSKCHEFAFSRPTFRIFALSFHFIFVYLGTVAPSVHENCFSGGRCRLDQNKRIWVSLQELPKFDISLAKMVKKHTLAQTKWNEIGKIIPLARLEVRKSISLLAAHPQVPLLWENPPCGYG